MNLDRRRALVALTVAGLLWGSTVPLSKLALGWLPPGWLTAIRVRAVCSPAVLAWGAAGYGGTVLLQNTGITRTSVSHAALLIGTAPVLVAIIAVVWHHSVVRPVAWAGFAVSLGGVGLIAAGGGGGANLGGDGMVLASVLLSAIFTVGQTRLLRGRDPIAVTAVQFLGAALVTAPFSALTEGAPPAPAGTASLLAVVALIAGGTLLPFTLFAFGQSRLPAEIAGAFLNIEPLVGAVAGVVVFGDPAGPAQLAGGAAILGGIALSSVRLPRRHGRPAVAAQAPVAAQAAPEPVLVAQAAGVDRPGVLDGSDLLDPLTVLDYPALLDHGGALDDGPVLDYGAVLDHHGGRRRVLAANRESSMAELAARHPADLRRARREHGVGRPPQVGRRRPRGQIRPAGRRQETRGPGDGRRGEPRPAVRA
jgi:O-acetylserine/cysteine efflux transporter